MVRVHIKGGAWKNTEDEILKAAVMKYGKYQWGRIASLMNKKSAKQCKARWYEWLDPSIRKTEWSREEDEKLLHAAKIMPCQWRSISSMVGRTAAQCLERYEKLLDAATQGESGAAMGEEARKLRVGEVDPHPETKPALPDAVDMEEEEKEMLQEARARMANTNGKKVKRKAREKQLEEARRLAVLQRKREMKAAGIDVSSSSSSRKKYKGIDFSKEIPYFHEPKAGFHDASAELMKPPPPVDFKSMTIKARAGTTSKEALEEKRRKKDLEKQKEALEKDPIKALEELQKQAEERRAAIRRASKLNLPSAQLSEQDMKMLAKMAYDPEMDESISSGFDATKQLLTSYDAKSISSSSNISNLASHERTPSRQDHIMIEAANQAKLRQMQTPLLGGDNAQLQESGFKTGAWKDALSTPNPLATPLRKNTEQSSTMNVPKGMLPPQRTPARDQLGLNTPNVSNSQNATFDALHEYQAMQKQKTGKLQTGLAALPAPKHTEFHIEIADVTETGPSTYVNSKVLQAGPTDAAEIERRRKIEAERKNLEIFNSRSTAAKRDLPRPVSVPSNYTTIAHPQEASKISDLMEHANELIKLEMINVLTNDCVNFPVSGNPPMQPPKGWSFDIISENELNDAKKLLEAEISAIELEKPIVFEHFAEDWQNNFRKSHMPDVTQSHKTSTARAQITSKLQAQYKFIKSATDALNAKLAPVEKKLGIYQGGYAKRSSMLDQEVIKLAQECWDSMQDLAAFEAQFERESIAQPQRLREATEALAIVSQREKELQLRYETLLERRAQLQQ